MRFHSFSTREKKRSNERNFSSLISALPDHHITYYIKYGLHFIRFGFTPAQTTTSSLEKFFKKKLRLRQGTVSYLAYRVLRERREKIFFSFFSLYLLGLGSNFVSCSSFSLSNVEQLARNVNARAQLRRVFGRVVALFSDIHIYLYSKREKERERKKLDVDDVCLGERDRLWL